MHVGSLLFSASLHFLKFSLLLLPGGASRFNKGVPHSLLHLLLHSFSSLLFYSSSTPLLLLFYSSTSLQARRRAGCKLRMWLLQTWATLHVTLHMLHFTLDTPRPTLHTLHFTLRTPQSTLYTTLHLLHLTLHFSQIELDTPHSTLYILHFALYT